MEQHGVVRAIVDDERNVGAAAETGDPLGAFEHFAAPEGFVADLKDACASLEEGFGRRYGAETGALERSCVENRVDARQLRSGQIEIIGYRPRSRNPEQYRIPIG